MKNVFLSALTLSLSLAACTNPNMNGFDATTSPNGIVEGEITPPENPISRTTVFLYADDGPSKMQCSGSVLSPTVILTAAHCVTKIDQAAQTISTHDPSNLSVLDPQKIELLGMGAALAFGTKILVHPLYIQSKVGPTFSNFNSGYDLALILLSQPLPSSFKPVIISDKLDELTKNQVFAAGFGLYSNDTSAPNMYALRHGPVTVDLSDHKVEVPVKMSDSDVMLNVLTSNTTSSPIISYKKTGKDAGVCHGDSGGPLYYEKDGEIYLAGVNVAITGDKEGRNCTVEGIPREVSVSMAGPQLSFVLNSFKELTSTSLPLVRDIPEKDPNQFEFYLKSPVLSSKNGIANLEGYAAVIDRRDNTLIFLDLLTASTICEKESIPEIPSLLVSFDLNLVNYFDGKTVLPIMMSHHGVIEGFIEGRAKLEGEKLKLVVFTVEGYLSAELPVKSCH